MNEQVINILSKKWVIPTVVGVVSFGSGAVAGYFLGKRNGDVFEVTIDEEALDFVEDPQMSLFDTWKEKVDSDTVSFVYGSSAFDDEWALSDPNYGIHIEFYDPITWEEDEEAELMIAEDEEFEAADEQNHLEQITNDYQNVPHIVNVFGTSDSQWVYEDELSVRTAEAPYVIHADEYFADEAGCDQNTVTYYAGDDILSDEFDVPMYNHVGAMGELKFGHGSKDSRVVYIRNEALAMEWEVLLHTGRFDVEVAGTDVEDAYAARELKHSVPRFRDE